MNSQKENFVYLLSCFLNNEKPVLNNPGWIEIYKLADTHSLCGIVGNEIKLLNENYPDYNLKSLFNQKLGYAVQDYEYRDIAYCFIKDFFIENKIDFIFVKGVVINKYYPVKELRTSGDIDVIIRENSFDKAVKLINENHLKILSYSSDTIIISYSNTDIEIHKYSDVKNAYFDNIFSLAKQNGYEYSLSTTDHLLFVICHIAKHLSYRGAGIRMLMDIDVLIRNISNFDEEEFYQRCRKTGIEKTAKVLLSLCRLWFNTPVNEIIDFKSNEELLNKLEIVFIDGGSFGYKLNSIPASYYKNSSSKIRVLYKLAFPDRNYLKLAYPYYNKNKFLLPVARANRIIDGLFKKRSVAKSAFSELNNKNKTNYQLELLKELNIL